MELRSLLGSIMMLYAFGVVAMNDGIQNIEIAAEGSDEPSPIALKLMGPAEVFDFTDHQIDQTRFFQAICEGHINLVKGVVKNKRVKPDRELTWHSVFFFYFGTGDKCGGIGFIPVSHAKVSSNLNTFKDFQKSAQPFIPLVLAVQENQFEIVRFFIEECKVNINACTDKTLTALHKAVVTYNIELVQYLIDHGANPLYNNNYATPSTILEEIDSGLAAPQEMGPERIAKLQKIKPIIEKALRTRNYPDPYEGESVSSSDSDGDIDGDQNSDTESPDATDSADDDSNVTKGPPPSPSSTSSTSDALPSSTSFIDADNVNKSLSNFNV